MRNAEFSSVFRQTLPAFAIMGKVTEHHVHKLGAYSAGLTKPLLLILPRTTYLSIPALSAFSTIRFRSTEVVTMEDCAR